MADFPELQPSTRLYSPGRFPVETYRTYAGRETRVRRGSLAHGHRLDLTFQALTPDDAKSIRDHYVTQQGNFASFSLPSVVWTGVSGYATLLESGYGWIYNGPPQINDESCGYQTVNVSLRAVYDYAVQGWTPGEYTGDLTPTDPGDSWDTAVAGACEMVPENPNQVVVYFTETEALSTSALADVTLEPPNSDIQHVWGTTDHLGETAYERVFTTDPPGSLGLYGMGLSVNLFLIGNNDFTFEAWVRSSTNNFPSVVLGSTQYSEITFVFPGFSVGISSGYNILGTELSQGFRLIVDGVMERVFFNDFVNSFQHISLQRINGETFAHRNGVLVDIGLLSEALSGVEISGILNIGVVSTSSVEGTSLGQVRLTVGQGLYGTGSFTPPSEPFYVPVG